MPSEIKGTWIVSFRSWADREMPGGTAPLAARMTRFGHLFDEAVQGDWYPEEALHELLEVLYEACDRDRSTFVDHCRRVSHEGVGRFFKIVLSMSSVEFLLRQVPTMWRRLRRGDGAVVTVASEGESSMVRYDRFPWFEHHVYEMFTVGSLTALAEMAAPNPARIVSTLERTSTMAAFRVPHG